MELGLCTKTSSISSPYSHINLNAVLRQNGILSPLLMEKKLAMVLVDVLNMRRE